MQKYVLAYYDSPQFSSPQEGKDHMTAWMTWREKLGDAVIEPGLPVGQSQTIASTGEVDENSPNNLSGVTIIKALSMADAIEMARICPHISAGGRIEVGEAMNMEM